MRRISYHYTIVFQIVQHQYRCSSMLNRFMATTQKFSEKNLFKEMSVDQMFASCLVQIFQQCQLVKSKAVVRLKSPKKCSSSVVAKSSAAFVLYLKLIENIGFDRGKSKTQISSLDFSHLKWQQHVWKGGFPCLLLRLQPNLNGGRKLNIIESLIERIKGY